MNGSEFHTKVNESETGRRMLANLRELIALHGKTAAREYLENFERNLTARGTYRPEALRDFCRAISAELGL